MKFLTLSPIPPDRNDSEALQRPSHHVAALAIDAEMTFDEVGAALGLTYDEVHSQLTAFYSSRQLRSSLPPCATPDLKPAHLPAA